MSVGVNFVVLAAGKGTRMKAEYPKVLAPLAGQHLIDFPLREIELFSQEYDELVGVVIGHQKEKVSQHLTTKNFKLNLKTAVQAHQLGTAHALKMFFEQIDEAWEREYTVVMTGDTPLIRANDIKKCFKSFQNDPSLQGVAATFIAAQPTGYGRIIKSDPGFTIIEEKDASLEQKAINEVNSGFYVLKTQLINEKLAKIDSKNKAGEFYLTDLFQNEINVKPLLCDNKENFLGVNNLKELEVAEVFINREKLEALMNEGVRFIDASNTYIQQDVSIGKGTVIYPGAMIEGETSIGENCTIESGVVIKNSIIGNSNKILANSYLEAAQLGNDNSIGPFARLRPGTILEDNVKIGNFVETKKAHFKNGAKTSHLSYVGDAEVGEKANIGCGFITCNYDGVKKHKTIIGSGTFIGSDCQAVAPIEIGKNSFVAAGTTLTKSVPDGAFAIGRSKQENKEGLAKKFLK